MACFAGQRVERSHCCANRLPTSWPWWPSWLKKSSWSSRPSWCH